MGACREVDDPPEFRRAVEAVRASQLRPEVRMAEMSSPRRLAPHSAAFSAEVALDDDCELASGRLVLLHDPAGHETWQGTFRVVTMARAELEPEMAQDPLLPEVGWSWLMDALHSYGAEFIEPSGTITRCSSQSFGGLADRPAVTEIEVRASWTPVGDGFAAHMEAWCELLCASAGLPPMAPGGVVTMPARRVLRIR